MKFYERENYELRNHYKRDAAESRIGEDSLIGDDGNDYLFAHVRDDVLYGGRGDDLVYGGSGTNQITDRSGQNDLRPGSNNRPEGKELDIMEDFQFAGMTSFEFRHVFDVVGTDGSATSGSKGDSEIIRLVSGPAGEEFVGLTGTDWRTVDPTSTPVLSWHPSVRPEHTLAGDFNGDGRDDIARFHYGKWWVSSSTGSGFTNKLWGTAPNSNGLLNVRVADTNGDGRDDIIYRVGGSVRVLSRRAIHSRTENGPSGRHKPTGETS